MPLPDGKLTNGSPTSTVASELSGKKVEDGLLDERLIGDVGLDGSNFETVDDALG